MVRGVCGTSASGQGFAGPVVADGRLILLFHRVRDEEIVEALDISTGNTQWRHAYPTSYRDDFGFDEGPRAVPVVADGRVYTLGAEGQLHALDLATGRALWSEDTMRRFRVPKGLFGAGAHPWWRMAGSSPTLAVRMRESLRSTPQRALCCGRRPTMKQVTRHRSAELSVNCDTQS